MIRIWSILKNSDRRIVLHLLLILALTAASASASEQLSTGAQALLKGKSSLESGNAEKAIPLLTAAYDKLPLLGDYALLWRARAYADSGNPDHALADLRTLYTKYKDSPLVKKAKLKEIEILIEKKDPSLGRLLEGYVKDNPSNIQIKYAYAQWLRDNNGQQKAKELLMEVFISAGPLSAKASAELSPSDITAADLLAKGKTLNAAWRFEEAEKVLREALASDNGKIKDEITDSLAYSLFRQKRYKDAADLYKTTKNAFWRARSVFRSGDDAAFQSELPEFINSPDNRVAKVILAYGAWKRRQGAVPEALKIFSTVLLHYPSAREQALWSMGWTYYLSRDYVNASKIFTQLASTYKDSKYIYWNRKCNELSGSGELPKPAAGEESRHDFYAYLTCLKNKWKPSPIGRSSLKISLNPPASERINMLARLGLKDEAASELIYLTTKNPAQNELVSICLYLTKLGHYKAAISLISRVPYSEELHDLYYPLAFWPQIEEAARVNTVDPYLLLSVAREESRFEPEARSITGAIGLMQLEPPTANRYHRIVKPLLNNSVLSGNQLADARTSILVGSCHLKKLLSNYDSLPLAIAAYNAGQNAVNEWLKERKYRTVDEFIEDIPYDETRNYVKKVMTTYFEYLRSNRDGDVSAVRTHVGEL